MFYPKKNNSYEIYYIFTSTSRPNDEIVPRIRLKENYLVTTVLSEVARHYSESYCLGLVGCGMRSRLIEVLCPRGVFLLFQNGVLFAFFF